MESWHLQFLYFAQAETPRKSAARIGRSFMVSVDGVDELLSKIKTKKDIDGRTTSILDMLVCCEWNASLLCA